MKTISWHEAEKQIYKESKWLKSVIDPPPFNDYFVETIECLNCLFREMAILIVRGDVKARYFSNLDWSLNLIGIGIMF